MESKKPATKQDVALVKQDVTLVKQDVALVKQDVTLIKQDITLLREDLKNFATKKDLNGFATKEDLKHFATKKDLNGFATKEDLNKLEINIQEDFKSFGELIVKMISNLPDKHYLDDKIANAKSGDIIRHKKVVKSSKHIASVVGRHHNKTKADIKDVLVAKETLNSI